MEDFGSILWTVVLIGFAIYSVVAKGRGKSEKHQHDEAWPSWDSDSDEEKTIDSQQTEDVSGRMPERNRSYGSSEVPGSYQPGAFPEEAQSLEEIPEQEYTSLEEPATTFSRTFNPRTKSAQQEYNTLANGSLKARNIASDQSLYTSQFKSQAAETTEISDNMASDKETSDIAADFDLRKAVIYSEMLKPKFDE